MNDQGKDSGEDEEQEFINNISILDLSHRLDQIIEYLNLGNTLFFIQAEIPENDINDIYESLRDRLRWYNTLYRESYKYFPEIHVNKYGLTLINTTNDSFFNIELNKDELCEFLYIFHYMLDTLHDIKMPEFIGPLIKG